MPHFESTTAALLPLTIGGPIVMAAIVLFLGRRAPRIVVDWIAIATAASVTGLASYFLVRASSGRLVDWVAKWTPLHARSVGIVLEVDPVGAGIALLAAVLVTCSLLFSVRYLEAEEAHYHALVLLFLAGMEGFALTGDLFDLFVFLELMGASAYALTAMQIEDPHALQGGLNFGVINSLGAYFSLMGIGLLYARTGDLQLPLLAHELGHHTTDALVVAGFVLVMAGFLVKGAVAPFHFWLADAHAVAPAPICLLFSGVMVPLGVYAIVRVYWTAFSSVIPASDARVALLVLGTATAIIGAVMSAAQRHIKRLLAYSTIAHVGLFLVALGLLNIEGTAAALIYVLGHAGVKGALFLLAGVLLDRYGNVDEIELFGRCRRSPLVGVLFTLGGLALAGLPPFGTSLGKSLAESAGIAAGYDWIPVLFIVVSAMTGGAVVRVAGRIFLGLGAVPHTDEEYRAKGQELPPPGRLRDRSPSAIGSIVLLMAGALVLGVVPGMHPALERAAASFVDQGAYVSNALGRAGASLPVGRATPNWTGEGLGLGFLSTLLALGFASAAWFGRPLLARIPRTAHCATGGLRFLHRMHSGHIGDYVAWLVVGEAILAGLIGLQLR